MKKWKIVSDSSCDILKEDLVSEVFDFSIVPLCVNAGGREYLDVPGADVDKMLADHKGAKAPSTSSCPSFDMWASEFAGAQYVIAITISGGMSGSYGSAVAAANVAMAEDPEKRIHVVDSRGTSGSLVLGIRRAKMLIEMGLDFEQVEREIETYMDGTHLLFSLASFDNLIQAGRMSRIAGIMAGSLGIRPVARNNERGEIVMLGKPRGELGAIKYIVKTMGELKKLEGRPVIISHCKAARTAELLSAMIQDTLGTSDITILETRVLCSYYALPGGLIVTF